jgi:NAD(P)-dependent dehydrogenase (short-subunit alcohol dehydrogenase family)
VNLDGKAAVVTGGTKGIGYAIAESLAREGVKVFICSRSRDDIEEAIGRLSQFGEIAGKLCDVRSEEQVNAVLDSCERKFGGVDILVNNAGIGINGKTVEELTSDEWRATLERICQVYFTLVITR